MSTVSCHIQDYSDLCHACQLGRHVRPPFHSSTSHVSSKFDLIHCDLWTSPVVSVSGYKYYLVILDDCTHYLWTFPLRLKSDTFSTLAHFIAHASTQFGAHIKAVQCDNGKEFDNSSTITSSSPRASIFVCPAPTPRLKMVKLNALFAPSITLFAPCSFRHLCLPPTEWRPSPR